MLKNLLRSGANMETIGIFSVISQNGDGSNSIHWFDGREVSIEELLELEEYDQDTWGSGDGLQVSHYVFPEGFDFDACGITFTNIEEIRLDQNY